jgi:hypothetical protein
MNRKVSQVGFVTCLIGVAAAALVGFVPVAGILCIPTIAFAVDLAIQENV